MTALLRGGISALCLGLLIGCGPTAEYKTNEQLKTERGDDHDHDDHGHGAAGPHGGSLVELGEEEYHAEVVVDEKTHSLVVYLLGKDAKTASPIAATEVTVGLGGDKSATLKAAPLEGEGEGKASKFELADEKVVHDLLDAGFLHGSLKVQIGEKAYEGHIDAHFDHDHDDHKDEKPAADKPAGEAPASETPADGAKPE
ncbi:hypothetical protein [Planctellipticum variicoloris]|jgi:hypothetical protein|uniref:hypothetical protein n=1 Tax=Planctellipticum variicoloris TaxID=3064265 RepID=UPI003013F115|nr:hypothetical protein SH412_004561 [Planctomycetaceae bacterium SH412]